MQHAPTNPAQAYASDKILARRYDVSRTTIWRWARTGLIPAPYRFTSQCSRWKLSEIIEWEENAGASA